MMMSSSAILDFFSTLRLKASAFSGADGFGGGVCLSHYAGAISIPRQPDRFSSGTDALQEGCTRVQ